MSASGISVCDIKTEEGVKQFFDEHLQYEHGNEEAKNACLQRVKTNELRHLYVVLYNFEPRTSIRKMDLLKSIERYFDGIVRSRILKGYNC